MAKKTTSPLADGVAAEAPTSRPAPQRIPLQSTEAPADQSVAALEAAGNPLLTPKGPPSRPEEELPQRLDNDVTNDTGGEPADAPLASHEAVFDGKPVTRETRKPFGSRDPRLAYPARPGYHRHWFNDRLDRIQRAHEAGYAHVNDAKGNPIWKPGGFFEGQAIRIYLMELPMQWRNEDLEARAEKSDELDQQVYTGEYKASPDDKRYSPAGMTSFQVQRGPGRG